MPIAITVGGKVVGAFKSRRSMAAIACLRMIAPGANPQIKKTPPSTLAGRGMCSNEARHVTNQVGNYKRVPPLLKPGEFTL